MTLARESSRISSGGSVTRSDGKGPQRPDSIPSRQAISHRIVRGQFSSLWNFEATGCWNWIRLSALAWAALIAAPIGWTQEAGDNWQPLTKASAEDSRATKIVAMLMQQQHLLSRPIDNSIAERTLDGFLKSLDPMKVYFLKTDVAEFKAVQDQIDDQMRAGDFSIAFNIFNRFIQRVDESVVLAHHWLDQKHDFTVDEEMVTDRDLLDYANSPQELSERWRLRIKYNLLVEEGDKKAKDDPVQRLKRRYSMYSRRMRQLDGEEVVEMFVTAMTSSFDPHTSYMAKRTFENFLIQMRLELEGIGATLSSNDDGYTVIRRIVANGAADKQGELEVEDRIVAVGQGPGTEMIDVVGMKNDDVVDMIRGKAGTTVSLEVLKQNSEVKRIEIVRERIALEDEAAHGQIFEEGQKADGSPWRIGVIDLPSFYASMDSKSQSTRSTTTDVRKILEDFNRQNVDALVLDLRRNGGGSLREAIDCTGLFIDVGPVVQVKDPSGRIEKLNDEARGSSWNKPMVVLTSKFSASASEILAGAVKDYDRGLIVGDTTTHGKGTVQSLLDLNTLIFRSENPPNFFGALKITMQQFYRPNGDSTQKRGVFSDIVLPSLTDKMDVAESDLDYAVEFDRVPEASRAKLNLINPQIVESLNQASAQRVAGSEFFQKENRRIAKYLEFKQEKSLSLNREKFLARRAEFNAEEEDKKTIEDQINRSSQKIERTPYLEEVLKITADYVNTLVRGS